MITELQYVVDRSEYVDPSNPTGPTLWRVTVSTVAPTGSPMPGPSRVLSGIVAADATAYAPKTALTVTYAPAS